jgi:putative nucleotidyltransferase with HDIG domain
LKEHLQHSIFDCISQCADELGIETYVIGGYVRDVILQRKQPKDIDIVCVGSGIELARKVAEKLHGKPRVQVFKNFGTAMVAHEDIELEFVGARKESYDRTSRKPTVENGTLEDDQNRRDFTINTLALCLNQKRFGELIDPFGGMKDLEDGIIKTPLEPNVTYSDDPLRMMRAIRFATQLDFSIETKSLEALTNNAHRLSIVSKERIIDELNKIILSDRPSKGFKLLFNTKLLHEFFPEFVALHGVDVIEGKKHKDNFYHTLEVLENLAVNSNDLWLRWAALLHDIAKPETKRFEKGHGWTFHGHEFIGSKMVPKIFKRLKLPLNEKMKFVQKLVLLHLRPIVLSQDVVSDSAIRRLLFDAGEDLESLMMLCEADITSKNKQKVKRFLNNFKVVREKLKDIEERDHIRNWQPPISGELIMETFQLKPCKAVGDIKNQIREAILDGVIPNDYDKAYDFMLEKGKDLGLEKQ